MKREWKDDRKGESMSLAERYDVFVFDGDGVLYLDDHPLPGARETIDRLKGLGKTLRFVTNDSYPSGSEMAGRLGRMGFPFTTEEIFPVGRAMAAYLAEQGISRAFVLGSAGFQEELAQAGVLKTTHGAEAVVLGYDKGLTLADYQQAGKLISEGTLFIAANLDLSFPTAQGNLLASGSIVRALEMATGVRARVIGKPSSFIFRFALREVAFQRAVMVGDNPDSDIIGAHRVGISGVLVGNWKAPVFPRGDYRRPEAVISSLPELFSPHVSSEAWENPGFPWPERVVPAVAAFIFDSSGRILLIKRVDNGYWTLPTGHVEKGESTEEAVIREVREETGLFGRVQALTGVQSDPRTMTLVSPTGEVLQYVTTGYLCEVTGGTLYGASSEVREVGYFPVSQLPHPMVEAHRSWIREAEQAIRK
ncbi:MAG TPA: HAD-IIA family hydrolase [Atribacteraceae bacterium]|nr:HAD-IIA family hydrolase [Atribacteraceae bacterium]